MHILKSIEYYASTYLTVYTEINHNLLIFHSQIVFLYKQGSCQLVTEVARERAPVRPQTCATNGRKPDIATQFPEMFRKQEQLKQQRASK